MKIPVLISLVITVTLAACTSNKKLKSDNAADDVNIPQKTAEIKSPLSHYDFNTPDKNWELDDSLKEISGIKLLDNGNFLGIEDLHPILYEIKTDSAGKGTIVNKYDFFDTDKKKLDFEDLEIVGNTVYALWSHGSIFKITDWRNNRKAEEISTSLDKSNNTEGLGLDPATGNLLIACKNDAGVEDEKKSTRAIYQFNVAQDKMIEAPFFVINKKEFKEIAGEKIAFYPSAIAVDPVSGDIFIISTKDTKCIAVFTAAGAIKDFKLLDKDLLPQPEGLCFDKTGNIYISTEGKGNTSPAILEFTKK